MQLERRIWNFVQDLAKCVSEHVLFGNIDRFKSSGSRRAIGGGHCCREPVRMIPDHGGLRRGAG